MHNPTQRLDLSRLRDDEPHTHIIENAQYSILISAAGTGYSTWGDYALTRWSADWVEDNEGFFIYARDLDSGVLWSLGYQPVQHTPARYEITFHPGLAEFMREDHGIESRMVVSVASDSAVETRRITLHNLTDQTRRLELTSYLEAVLNHPMADAAHPGFSKLFLQTEFVPECNALLARRRPRGADEAAVWMGHALAGATPTGFETDRARFLGRCRSLASPQTFDVAALSSTVGNVLDPVLSLRCEFQLAPSESCTAIFSLAAGRSREEVLRCLRDIPPS
jgi:cyclic beta-1,2-glucan synthetase